MRAIYRAEEFVQGIAEDSVWAGLCALEEFAFDETAIFFQDAVFDLVHKGRFAGHRVPCCNGSAQN